MTRLRYFTPAGKPSYAEEDDPFNRLFVPLEKRTRLEQARWHARRNRKPAEPQVELDNPAFRGLGSG